LSLEQIVKAIVSIELSETDARVYVFLALNGPHRAREISSRMNLYKAQLYRVLKSLQSKGMVNASPEYPARYSAVLFEKVLDLLIKAKKEQQQALQESKEELLSTWRSITKKKSPDS
jgi:sugar-specific transcriptional regulator TrmB